MGDEIVLDSLAYVEEGYDALENQINSLIRQEINVMAKKDYLESIPAIKFPQKEGTLLKNEWNRIEKKEPLKTLDVSRYQLEAPPANKINDVNLWKLSLQNAESQLEHQNIWMTNLELLQSFGANAWRLNNETLEAEVKRLSNLLESERKEIEDLNRVRKEEQTKAIGEIRNYESKWKELVVKNVEIEKASSLLLQEIASLKQKEEQIRKKQEEEEDL